MLSPEDDPITHYLYGIAWEKAMERLPEHPQSTLGPVTRAEHLALLATLSDFASGVEENLLFATHQACLLEIPQAEIGRSCGISRQAVRQRFIKAAARYDSDDLAYFGDDFEGDSGYG
ncbi:hypothetical protein ABZ957_08635 [Streptomyces sp. NPDC046316]|uniref:hypothetical protein n=1 Tax=Streptomyces sp. NPDC046316 TaxID=3154494 RepID=UPI0034029ADB